MGGQPGPGLVSHVPYFRWETPLHWFGPTLGPSIWLVLCGGVLLLRGHGPASAAFLAGFAVLVVAATWAWWRRDRRSAVTVQAFHKMLGSWRSGRVDVGV